jgi:cytochrome c nitrite reductase small subunit
VRTRRLAVSLAALVGIIIGLSFFTFDYAEGFSYFSTDPRACANCHIMNSQYDSWTKAPHHGAARCVDCHLPHDFVPKYMAKASNGYHHSKGFTFMDFHEPIMIKPNNAGILQDSCIRCHEPLVHELVHGSRSVSGEAVQCVHCHRNVGHGARN